MIESVENERGEMRREDLEGPARGRAEQSPTGIGAVWDRNITENDRDGQRHSLAVSDGTGFRWTEVILPGLDHDVEIDPTDLAAAVEHYAGRFPTESRLQDLQDKGPHSIDLGR